eukprot:TRINITY_DN11510_c0_g1_i1.p1 TRINITY_DN11510_c0_g1~~TRINITY_DN11510_c0_g1_i1.p1  ORF type:complete len:626 (+),score=139.18 TRINITY_DN11510_c0_g1_i1:65-1879(+)
MRPTTSRGRPATSNSSRACKRAVFASFGFFVLVYLFLPAPTFPPPPISNISNGGGGGAAGNSLVSHGLQRPHGGDADGLTGGSHAELQRIHQEHLNQFIQETKPKDESTEIAQALPVSEHALLRGQDHHNGGEVVVPVAEGGDPGDVQQNTSHNEAGAPQSQQPQQPQKNDENDGREEENRVDHTASLTEDRLQKIVKRLEEQNRDRNDQLVELPANVTKDDNAAGRGQERDVPRKEDERKNGTTSTERQQGGATAPVAVQNGNEGQQAAAAVNTSTPPVPKELRECIASWGAKHKDFEYNPEQCPRTIPAELYDRYTLNRTIDVVYHWKCQSGPAYAKRRYEYTVQLVESNLHRARVRGWDKYGMTDEWLYKSIDKHPFKGKDVVVMGSQTPWYESVCLTNGARSCTTIDFQRINNSHPNLTTLTLAEYDKNPRQFDVAISISSFEHDGLGRYGDPPRPESDIEAMKKMKCVVRPGGWLFLSIPIGQDKIVFNMHRVYGPKRLPLMLEHWRLLHVEGYGFHERYKLDHDGGREAEYQPILVLENVMDGKSHREENDRTLDRFCEATKRERFVFPFGKYTENDPICYKANLSLCEQHQIKPRFW